MSGGGAYLEPSSVMDEMMALFAPPGRGDSSVERKAHVDLHPYFKRPGLYFVVYKLCRINRPFIIKRHHFNHFSSLCMNLQ